ncbi:MAG: nuclear transport factor 2 family protein [Dehalococcoidia bacterium]
MTPRSALIDAYLDAVERFDAAAVRDCLHPDVTVLLHANAFAPEGSTTRLDALIAALEAGRGLLATQRFSDRVYSDLVDGTVLATMTWTGETAIEMPGVAAGTVLKADIASRLTFEGDRLLRQENWDCYYPPQPPDRAAKP